VATVTVATTLLSPALEVPYRLTLSLATAGAAEQSANPRKNRVARAVVPGCFLGELIETE
jgi:hypothetical protein